MPAAEPTWGSNANQPVKVADDVEAIVQALGLSVDELDKSQRTGYVATTADLPFVEY